MNKLTEYSQKHRRTWLAFVLIAPLVIGCLMIFAAQKADGAPDRMCTHNPDMTCKWTPKKTARKFREGYYKRAHGANLSAFFEQPAKSRQVFVRKVHRKIANMSPEHRRKVQGFVNGWIKSHSAARTGGNVPEACSIKDWWCLSRASVFTVVHGATCRGGQYYSVLRRSCAYPGPEEHFMTVKQTIAVGGAFFCGGTVVVGAITTPASGGTTAFVAGWGATSCMFSTWAALQ
jgi:hypothetical protein